MIKHAIFDLGQVLLLQKSIEIDFYLSKIFNSNLENAHDFYFKYRRDLITGKISSWELLAAYKSLTHEEKSVSTLYDLYVKSYLSDYVGINHELIKYIDNIIKPNINVHIFTNTIDCHDKEAQKLGIYEHFDRVFKSYTDHIFKPEPASFTHCVDKLSAKPKECVFIDDLEINVNGAKATGLWGIVYNNNTQLERDLSKLLAGNQTA